MSETAEPVCQDVQAHLLLHVGGDLEPSDAERVAAHLARCPSCSAELRAAQRARAALLVLREERAGGSAGADLWPAVRAVLSSEGALFGPEEAPRPSRMASRAAPDRAPAPGALVRLARWGVPAAAAAAIALTALVGLRDGRGPSETAQPLPPVLLPSAPGLALGAGSGTRGPAPVVPVVPAGLRRIQPGEELLRDTAAVYPSGFQPAPPVARSGRWPPQGGPRPRVAGDGELR